MKNCFFCLVIFLFSSQLFAQTDTDYVKLNFANPKTYTIAGIDLEGTDYYDKSVLIVISGLQLNQSIRVPSDDFSKAITNLWKQKLFDDIKIVATKIEDDQIWLKIIVSERPRLSTFSIKGLKKGKAEDLREQLTLKSGQIITENVLSSTQREIRNFFAEKGFLDASAVFEQTTDDIKRNTAKLKIIVDRGRKIKISDILFEGNIQISDRKLRRQFKKTKPKYRFLAKSRFIEDDYQEDKQKLLAKYYSMGYRDAQILSDSIWRDETNNIKIKIKLYEGHKYYFRNINFVGNSKYTSEELAKILRIKSGDVYDQSLLDQRLNMSQDGMDISTLYMDDGYLFFRVEPVEVNIENDSIDIEVRIFEGTQARINKVTVKGNTKTSDYVIIRELRSKPGQLFSRSDITRSIRELATVGYFNPEALNVNPVPNPVNGTVDIEYKVEERANDQIELSGGWGAGFVVGTLGLTLNNFSARKFLNPKAWNPVPTGDGQRLSLRAQTNGTFFQSYSASFTEPWLGGKKPNAFTASVYHSVQSNGLSGERRSGLFTTGVVLGLGRRLRFPDDFFTLQYQLSYQRYQNIVDVNGQAWIPSIPAGGSNNISFRIILGRNSTDQPIYPRSGSNISLSVQATPPYSLFTGIDYKTADQQTRMEWLEFHKWKFDATWFTRILGNLVLMSRVNYGFIGTYNIHKGTTPFERFWVGGSGLMGFNLDGRELIALRGYADNSLTPFAINAQTSQLQQTGATIYNRYTMELRYPISLNPQATVFPLVFAEAGGAWLRFRDFNPFQVNRSYGIGVRIFLPMFGMIGLDYGWGIDRAPFHPSPDRINGGQFHFLLGQQF
jgi:outer membrane protein insertion porin family